MSDDYSGPECFVTEAGPVNERRRAFIYRDPEGGAEGTVRGWCFVVEKLDADGTPTPIWDTWEETFEEILRYPPGWLSGEMIWRDEKDDFVKIEDYAH